MCGKLWCFAGPLLIQIVISRFTPNKRRSVLITKPIVLPTEGSFVMPRQADGQMHPSAVGKVVNCESAVFTRQPQARGAPWSRTHPLQFWRETG